MRWPIAETFYSIQGEGVHTGTPMLFVRLAGCNVGKYLGYPIYDEPFPLLKDSDLPLLREQRHSVCTSHDGTRFLCDTDYHRAVTLDDEAILGLVNHHKARYVCISGGEPFLHDNLHHLIQLLEENETFVHIETSGTLPIEGVSPMTWVTCCPKMGYDPRNREQIDEWKFLVACDTQADSIIDFIVKHEIFVNDNVFVQPINAVHVSDKGALANAIHLVQANPAWRLSAQLHKYLEVR